MLYQMQAQQNVETMNAKKVKKVIYVQDRLVNLVV